MALIEYDEYKQRLRDLGPELEKLSAALDMDSARAEARKLEDETAQDGFWNDLERSQKVQQRLKQLQNKIARQDKLVTEWQDLTALCEMGQEAEDEELLEELKSGFQTLEEKIEESRMATLLSGEYDGHSAILTFHAGAGGTEAQDWAQMLYRMYTRWTERHDFTYQILDYEDGDEAGIKSASIAIQGDNAYGLLKSENGVHRLVRVSPFDANARRQTSFAAVEVMPEIEDDDEVETYKLVTTVRGNSMKGLISSESPLGSAVMGHRVGDRVYVRINDKAGYYVVVKRLENTPDDGSDKLRSY